MKELHRANLATVAAAIAVSDIGYMDREERRDRSGGRPIKMGSKSSQNVNRRYKVRPKRR
jgi:hypothetical protein